MVDLSLVGGWVSCSLALVLEMEPIGRFGLVGWLMSKYIVRLHSTRPQIVSLNNTISHTYTVRHFSYANHIAITFLPLLIDKNIYIV